MAANQISLPREFQQRNNNAMNLQIGEQSNTSILATTDIIENCQRCVEMIILFSIVQLILHFRSNAADAGAQKSPSAHRRIEPSDYCIPTGGYHRSAYNSPPPAMMNNYFSEESYYAQYTGVGDGNSKPAVSSDDRWAMADGSGLLLTNSYVRIEFQVIGKCFRTRGLAL